jgi:hypothetical protein
VAVEAVVAEAPLEGLRFLNLVDPRLLDLRLEKLLLHQVVQEQKEAEVCHPKRALLHKQEGLELLHLLQHKYNIWQRLFFQQLQALLQHITLQWLIPFPGFLYKALADLYLLEQVTWLEQILILLWGT